MRKSRKLLSLVAVFLLLVSVFALCVSADSEAAAAQPKLFGTFVSLLPPIIAIALALITKEVYSSLFIGILVGGFMASDFSVVGTINTSLRDGIIASVESTAGIFVFLVVLGIIVAIMNKAGGSYAFGKWAEKNIKSRTGALLATFALGVLIFIDDYFNCLTVGSVMRPVTDTHKISRAKLAYIIDATAAPICMIAPISSWAAAVSKYAEEAGVDGIKLFVQAIPYNFYSLLTIVFVIAISVMKFDYGSMRIHEINARAGDLYTSGEKNESAEVTPSAKGRIYDLIIPIVVLVIVCVLGLIYIGGYFGTDAWGGTENAGKFIGAFGNTDATIGLPLGGIIALVAVIIYVIARRVVTFKEAMECIPTGFIAMVPAILILTFATSLKNMTTLLGSDTFVDNAMKNVAPGLENLLPAIIFLVACGIAFATGTSWGTFGILIPIVIAIFGINTEIGIIGISACLAGSVCGDHCSPISDTTIMSSAGAQCNHLNHVSTQIPYAVSVAAISFVMFLIAGYVQNAFIVLPLGIILTVAFLFVTK